MYCGTRAVDLLVWDQGGLPVVEAFPAEYDNLLERGWMDHQPANTESRFMQEH